MQVRTIQLEPVLNSATEGLLCAERVLSLLSPGDPVCFTWEKVERITPSYANALVFTVAERVGLERAERLFGESKRFEPAAESIRVSIDRYRRGIRLSSQQPSTEQRKAG